MEKEKKRKRSEESEKMKPPAPPLLAGLRLGSGALQIALQHVVAFLPTSDYAAVCLSNSNLRNAVESLTKEQLVRIRKDHAVDETFEERIQEQSQLETKRTKPVRLPFRYLRKKAGSVHLYTIGPAMQGESQVSAMAFFPASSKNRIVLVQEDRGAGRSLIQIWDVRTKKCVCENSFEKTEDDWGVSDKHYAIDIICMGSNIVVCHNRMIQVWNESLALLQEQRFGNDPCHVERWVQHGPKLLYFKDGRIFSLDILNGFHPQEMVVVFETEEQRPAQVDMQVIGVCGEWLVANCYHRSGNTPPTFCALELGLRVYSLSDEHTEQDRLTGNNYICVQQSEENPAIFYALRVYKSNQASNITNRTGSSSTQQIFQLDPREGVVDVVELSRHGKLSFKSSFAVVGNRWLFDAGGRKDVFAGPGSLAFIPAPLSTEFVKLYDTEAGSSERTFTMPAGHSTFDAVMWNEKEIFAQLNTRTEAGQGNGSVIAAYLKDD